MAGPAPRPGRSSEAGLVRPGWQKELPNNSIAANFTIAFFTRKGNPKKIRTWRDLERSDVQVITANPATHTGGTEAAARRYLSGVLRNGPVLPRDAREATDTFITLGKGDGLLNWESEVYQAK